MLTNKYNKTFIGIQDHSLRGLYLTPLRELGGCSHLILPRIKQIRQCETYAAEGTTLQGRRNDSCCDATARHLFKNRLATHSDWSRGGNEMQGVRHALHFFGLSATLERRVIEVPSTRTKSVRHARHTERGLVCRRQRAARAWSEGSASRRPVSTESL